MLTALFIGVIGPLAMNSLIDEGINAEVVIDSTSAPSFKIWQTNTEGDGTKVKIQFDLYFFDLQNPKETLQGAKPVVVEKGPYAYDENYYKFDIEWEDDGDMITFNNQRYFVFNPSRTGAGLSEDDQLVLPYASVIGFQYFLGKVPVNASELIEIAILNKTTTVYEKLDNQLTELNKEVLRNPDYSAAKKIVLTRQIRDVQDSVQHTYNNIYDFVLRSSPTLLLMKLLLSFVPSGVSPFWTAAPGKAYFGWLNDPLLMEVQGILNLLEAKTGKKTPWTSAVSGAVTNYTTVDDTRRRRQRDTLRTGKKNKKQVMQYVRAGNSTEVWSCIAPLDSKLPYTEGKEFPACATFQENWSVMEAEAQGYNRPYGSPYANRVAGSNAELYGRPVTTDSVQIYIGDIYRSAFILKTADINDLYDLKLKRYQLQFKDLENCTTNPSNCAYYNFAPNGMGNLTGAVNAPAWISNPHFTDADPSLIGAISGMVPNVDTHRTYLDIEPQTGQLVRGKKALQENWMIESTEFPTVSPSLLANTSATCNKISTLLNVINALNGTNYSISCDLTAATLIMSQLAIPTDWKFSTGDRIFFPLAYCEEYNVINEDDANELKESIYGTETLIKQVQQWSFVVAGASFVTLCIMYYLLYAYPRLDEDDIADYKLRNEKDRSAHGSTPATVESFAPLLGMN